MEFFLNKNCKLLLPLLTLILSSCSDLGSIIEKSKEINVFEKKIASDNFTTSIKAVDESSDKQVYEFSEENKSIKDIEANPTYKIGNPYEINDIWYYPEKNLNYDSSGIASWYGEKFHGKLTANGEIFNKKIVSAAHQTLPLPSMVRVTNLDNGKVLNVRVNDRGPYIHGRIIDLSEKGAELLGFKEVGTARVNVRILAEQSLWIERKAKEGDFSIRNNSNSNSQTPKIKSVIRPNVIISNISKNEQDQSNKLNNNFKFTELIQLNRIGLMNEIEPIETQIWIQVGAFSSIKNAERVISIIKDVFDYDLSTIQINEQILHRVRLGPTQNLSEADYILEKVFKLGYSGSEIIVE